MLGRIDQSRLALEEIHRFPNRTLRTEAGLEWDMAHLIAEIKRGLAKAAGLNVRSFGCDSWGVDYLLFDSSGQLLPPAFHYRDGRAGLGVKRAYARVDWPTIFAETGIQFMPINTIFQIASERPERLEQADRLLLVADGINYVLSGVAKAEETLASTSQVYNPVSRSWSKALLDRLSIPERLFAPIVPPGTRLGPLRAEVERETGLRGIEVLATCSHDTAAAVVGVPAQGTHWAYISSGTWSLLGVELPRPILTDDCRELNFTNEIGYGGSVRLLKNIVGLWVIQECKRYWAERGEPFEYGTLTDLAGSAEPFVSLIDLTDSQFVEPGAMPEKIGAYCRGTGQPGPSSPGATVRAVLESLALLYRRTLRQVERLIGSRIQRLHIVGGGSKNTLLNQFTANACQVQVVAGPVEATAAGNVVVQALALGQLSSLAEARKLIGESFPTTHFEPRDVAVWAHAYDRLAALAGW